MVNNMKKRFVIISIVLLTVVVVSTTATPIRTWNHTENPAFLSAGNRSYFELGFSASPGFQNSYFTTKLLSNPTWVIDFNDINDSLGDKGFRIGGKVDAELHNTVHLFNVGVGVYANTDTIFQASVPKKFFEFLAEGIELETTYEDTGEADLKSFTEYGAYMSYRLNPYTFSLKMGKYVPLAYARTAEGVYKYESDQNGTITASAGVDAKLFSAFDLENMDNFTGEEVFTALTEQGGINIDLGFLYGEEDEDPLWGASISNIPLVPAESAYGWDYSIEAKVENINVLDSSVENEELSFGEFDDPEGGDFTPIDESENIYMPFRIGGFYRYGGVPLIDIIPHSELVFGGQSYINGGVTVEGASFPLSILSLGLGYQDIAWEGSLGLRMNLRVLELEMRLSQTSPEMLGLFSTRGIGFNLFAAIGF